MTTGGLYRGFGGELKLQLARNTAQSRKKGKALNI
jgi:hypothetical protein